ncbi:MAG: DRTGG domain-containing protein [Lentihominibacter sp.]
MQVKEMLQAIEAVNLTGAGSDNEVTGVYACDLLSRVMSDCNAGDAWITVQTHLNILAVAELDEASCIIVPQGISIEEATLEKAREKDIAVLSTKLGTYEICWRLHEVL